MLYKWYFTTGLTLNKSAYHVVAVCVSMYKCLHVYVWMFLLHSCRWPYVSASWVPGARMLLWPCGLRSETPRRFLLKHSHLPPFSPSLPPSTTPWSTCCVSPTFVSASTGTRLCYGRGSTGGVHSQIPKSALDPARSATRTWASPRASPMGSRRATARVCTAMRMQHRVMWPLPKGLPASWLDPPTERWQLPGSLPSHRLIYSSGTTSSSCCFYEADKMGQLLKRTEIIEYGQQNNKEPAQAIKTVSQRHYSMTKTQSWKDLW